MNDQGDDDDIDLSLDGLLSDEDEIEENDEKGTFHLPFNTSREATETSSTCPPNSKNNDIDHRTVSRRKAEDALESNKELLKYWQQLKTHTITLLERVERKLAAIEDRMQNRAFLQKQMMYYTPGIPYFKDKNHFHPHQNEDELLMKTRGELQVDTLPKVSPWSSSERAKLSKAIWQEAITTVLQDKDDDSDSNSSALRLNKTQEHTADSFLPSDFKKIVGPLGTREFDWAQIAVTCFPNKHSAQDCRVMWNVFLHPEINKDSWKRAEDLKLKEIVSKNKCKNWDKIAKELNTHRSAYQCFIRYNSTKKVSQLKNCTWPPEEDKKLQTLVQAFEIGDFVPWGEIATLMDNRTRQQIYVRWTYSLLPDLVKGRFTKSEDKTFRDGIMKYGTNFRKIATDLMPNRSTVQLNDHYQRFYPEGVQKPQNLWTDEQDNKLLLLYERYGPKWSKIAKEFAGKNRTQVRHRHTALRKWIRKGVRVFSVVPKHILDEEEQSTDLQDDTNPSQSENPNITDNVDVELIEYFRRRKLPNNRECATEHYSPEDLRKRTENLYKVLNILGAQLDIPSDLDDWPLSGAQKQLLGSLKEYTSIRNNPEINRKIIEQCASHMFPKSSVSNEQTVTTTEQQPSGSRKNAKRKLNAGTIDYNLDKNQKFIFDPLAETEAPAYVKPVIKDYEEDKMFDKLTCLLQAPCSTTKKQCIIKKVYVLPPNTLSIGNTDDTAKKCSSESVSLKCSTRNDSGLKPSTSTSSNTQESHRNSVPNLFCASNTLREQSFPTIPSEEITENEPTAVEASYESLQGFKNLLYLKNLSMWMKKNNGKLDSESEDSNTSTEDNTNETGTNTSKEYDDAYALLEKRMLQLLKYPLGLSKTELPNLHNPDLVFLSSDDEQKRSNENRSKRSKKVSSATR